MRDQHGCRVYARFLDMHGSLVVVKQDNGMTLDRGPGPRPNDRVWIFLERQKITRPPRQGRALKGARAEHISPLLNPEQVRALIRSLEAHLKVVESGEGPETKVELFDYESPEHMKRRWSP